MKGKIFNILLQPIMYLFFDNKKSHWWSWSPIKISSDKWITINKDKPSIRNSKNMNVFDLYKTLFVLKETAILEPVNYSGHWNLIVRWRGTPSICDIQIKGRVKNVTDGEKKYLGLTKDKKVIKLKLLEICDRSKYENIIFI